MLSGPVIITVAFLYLCLLFAIAYYGDKRADQKRSLIANPTIYALSIAVYCTSWTFYGSVGRAASTGVDFLPIYLGPTLTFIVAWFVIRKIIRISKVNRITSIADFVASRYGKSFQLGGLVTVIAVVGILPYISLQLKAISTSFSLLLHYPEIVMPTTSASALFLQDTAFYVALIMGVFAILFGTRHIDASEQHEGMVAAIAFESVVKLVAFLAVGLFVTFGLYGGFGDIFARAEASGALSRLFTIDGVAAHTSWITLTLLAMGAIVVLPRQFQVLVVENVDERHLRKAMWLFPLYLLLINIFVLPIAFAGLLHVPAGRRGCRYLRAHGADEGAAAHSCADRLHRRSLGGDRHDHRRNGRAGDHGLQRPGHAVAPACRPLASVGTPGPCRHPADDPPRHDHPRGAAWLCLCPLIGESYALVTIGLVSFAAAMQFVPAIVGGIYWKGATKAGAVAGLTGGFLVWIYTLLLPSFARSGWISQSFVENGPLGVALLKPYALFGLDGLDPIAHATIWTMLVNVGLFVAVSLMTSQSMIERSQAVQFVEIFKRSAEAGRVWRGRATIGDLKELLVRFIGEAHANGAFARFERENQRRLHDHGPADSDIVSYSERQLAGAIGAASARIMVASVLREEMHDIDEVVQILDEASQLVVYSRQLEQKSRELEAASAELTAANERLKELDKMKDDFIATVSHEVRTPLTSIRSFSEILRDNPDLDPDQRQEFTSIIVQESERLSRLINDILDLAKMEAGTSEWHIADLDSEGSNRAGARRYGWPLPQDACHLARDEDRRRSSADPGRCGSLDPGHREFDVQRREVLRRRERLDQARSSARSGLSPCRCKG